MCDIERNNPEWIESRIRSKQIQASERKSEKNDSAITEKPAEAYSGGYRYTKGFFVRMG